MAQQFSLPGSLSAASNSQILSQPLQPLRPPRPSWTVRRDDPQPMYARQQVQLTTNGMVAVPRVRPTPAPLPPLLAPQHQPAVMSAAGAAVRPLDPAQQLLNTQKEAGTVHPVSFSINTGLLPVSDQQQQQQQALSRQWASQQRTGSGTSPQSPYRDGQNSADRVLWYVGSSTYRSRNSAHVDFDELHLVRPAQLTWSPTPQQQQQRSTGPCAQQQSVVSRRRSAVIEVFDDLLITPEPVAQEHPALAGPIAVTTGRGPPLAGQQRSHPPPPSPATDSLSSMTLPARYHGTNHPHSPYYAHGTSAATASFNYRPGTAPTSSPTAPRSARPHEPIRDTGLATTGGKYNQTHPSRTSAAQMRSRRGIGGMFFDIAPLKKKNSVARNRRISLSPVLSALQPGNYHIANLLDGDMDESSDDSSTGRRNLPPSAPVVSRPQTAPQHADAVASVSLAAQSALPAAINTALLKRELGVAAPCDTGDSTVTPLSVVNVLLGIDSSTTSPSHTSWDSRASDSGLRNFAEHARTRGPLEDFSSEPIREETVIFDAESIASDQECVAADNDDNVVLDLIEHAALIEEALYRNTKSMDFWDAEEVDDGLPSPIIFDAEEIDGESDGALDIFDAEEVDDGDDNASSVHIDAYETESIFSMGDYHQDQPLEQPALEQISLEAPLEQQQQQIVDQPSVEKDDDPALAAVAVVQPMPFRDVNESDLSATLSPQQPRMAATFKVKGVRHVLSYGADFDKTAATLLSSIKSDIARKAAAVTGSGSGGGGGGGGGGSSSNSGSVGGVNSSGSGGGKPIPSVASIAAAIEYHQKKQKKPDEPAPAPILEQLHPKHTSRFSGLFGFGPRSQKHVLPMPPPDLPPPAPSKDPLKVHTGGVAGLRVVTDFHSLRGSPAQQANDTPSSDGKKSASPSALHKRWRVPFRTAKTNASGGDMGTASTAMSNVADCGNNEDEVVSLLTPRSAARRSRYRAGTTSDIESPQGTAMLLATVFGERPSSMVESGSSGSGSGSSSQSTPIGRVAQMQVPGFSQTRSARILQAGTLPLPARVRFQGIVRDGGGSASGSDSETVLAIPFGRAAYAPPMSTPEILPLTAGSESDGRSFVTASPGILMARPESHLGTPKPIEKANSWTLMFFNKEFVVEPPSTPATLINESFAEPTTDEPTVDEPTEDDELWGGRAPSMTLDDDLEAADIRADFAEQHNDEDDAKSVSSSIRTLPSTMRFTRGMRATLLERRPSQNVRGRPTADAIGEQLDEYFPDHDLDKPIVQSVVLGDDGLLMPNHQYHIILNEEEANAAAAVNAAAVAVTNTESSFANQPWQQQQQFQQQQEYQQYQEEEVQHPRPPEDNSLESSGELPGVGVGRRKSVRMLVQETRQQRKRQQRSRYQQPGRLQDIAAPLPFETVLEATDPVLSSLPMPMPSITSSIELPSAPTQQQPPPILRRKSTKLWGCIPEEIRPREQYQQPLSANNNEIVRRALSLLRKPESDPQAEKAIVEAAIKSGDGSSIGSTRAHFVYERARQEQQQQHGLEQHGSGQTGQDALAKVKLQPITIQWIKGKLIGKGSFGHVHVAINAATGEVIAVKQIRLPKSLCAAKSGAQKGRNAGQLEEAIRMMYTEVELLKDLDHENIVQLLGFEVVSDVISMFLEYVSGGTVHSLVQQHGPLPESVVHSFLRQIVAGLGYLHDRGILHRDIKGANILVDETGTCKISDFGISRKADHSSLAAIFGGSEQPAARGRIIGTVPFMAPEVARASRYTAAADIWSLGCVVVQMWSGRQPWDELQEPQVFFKLGRGEAPPIPDDLTEAGLEFCKNCFAADPLQRWAADELAQLSFAQIAKDYEYPYYTAAAASSSTHNSGYWQ
ncbi:mitogen-activated protein kinase kinase kinase [Kickxella alabastrina]|uniref:Mitogen-activated protein kinase kinase kinase n=1 Tax=Kickxella alabastrina TaxID=61397 RepID=A0ACC1IPA9_9FUNG|nr:mitogen-activated protein kinase kinase kinase [Kickxella alabastrina]